MFDLETLNLNELKQLQKDVTAAIEQFKDRARPTAPAALAAVARARRPTVADLSELSLKRNRKPAAPNYANPADTSQTWTGRGRQPRWVVAALADGKTLDDLAI